MKSHLYKMKKFLAFSKNWFKEKLREKKFLQLRIMMPSSSPSLGSCLFAGTISIFSVLILISSVTILDVVHGFSVPKPVIDSPLLSQRIGSSVAIIVDPNGNGDFKTIQSAIDAVPEGNPEWITIHVKEGTYRCSWEKIYIYKIHKTTFHLDPIS